MGILHFQADVWDALCKTEHALFSDLHSPCNVMYIPKKNVTMQISPWYIREDGLKFQMGSLDYTNSPAHTWSITENKRLYGILTNVAQ